MIWRAARVLTVLMLAGCATTVEPVDAHDGMYRIDCSGRFGNWDACYAAADKACMAAGGYAAVQRLEPPHCAFADQNGRILHVTCKKPATAN